MSNDRQNEDVGDIEAALGSLTPAPSGIDRDTLMFRAGQASTRHTGRGLPVAAVLMALTTAVLGGALLMRPAPRVTERVVYVQLERPQTAQVGRVTPEEMDRLAERGRAWAEYVELRRRVSAEGPDALPTAEPAESSAPLGLQDILLSSGGSI